MAEADQPKPDAGLKCAVGEVIFREGDVGHTMYVLTSGKVRISKKVQGQERTLAVLGPGDFFGEMAILNGAPRTATATAESATKLLVLSAKAFEKMVVKNAEIAVRLLRKLAGRLDAANQLIEVLMHPDPRARVVLGLSREVRMTGVPQDDGSVGLAMSDTQLADRIGLSHRDTAEVLQRLRRLGIVRFDPIDEKLTVTNAGKLEEFLHFLGRSASSSPPASGSSSS